MPKQQTCTILSKVWLNQDTVYLSLLAGDMVRSTFKGPGQFLHIKCGDGLMLRRPISVSTCSTDGSEDQISVVFEIRGQGTAWLAQRDKGETLDVLGLLGNGYPIAPESRCLLVGGGIGVPPLLGCAQYTQGRSSAILGFRSSDKGILQDRFRKSCASVQLATDDGSLGYHGFVDAVLQSTLEKDASYDAVLACGPKPMLKNVAAVAQQFGIPCWVSMEERMGCGVGACLVCACGMKDGRMAHVCKDGPVFNAQEVDWNA